MSIYLFLMTSMPHQSTRSRGQQCLITKCFKFVLIITSASIRKKGYLTTSLLKLKWKTKVTKAEETFQLQTLRMILLFLKLMVMNPRYKPLRKALNSPTPLQDLMEKKLLQQERVSSLRCKYSMISQQRREKLLKF